MSAARGGGLDARLAALAEAAGLAAGRLDPDDVAPARAVMRRAGERLGLGVEATVVALAGPTGAGKSSLFNALAGGDVVATGVRRPTTAAATAAIWGEQPAALLDWLDVRLRHAVPDGRRDGLVLVDLPDFDSVERSHRVEAERLIGLVDLLVWVVDPQKYADAALHQRYLVPLATHSEAMLVVLNHADRLDEAARASCRDDLRRLLAAEGLAGVAVLATSARTGEGLDALGDVLAERVEAREAAVARLAADTADAAAALARASGCEGGARDPRREHAARLTAALARAAGVPAAVRALDRAHRRRGALATGWPVVRWALRLRPDPLRRVRLGEGDPGRTSLPGPTPVQRAEVSSAIRSLAAASAGELPDPWPGLVRSAASKHEEALADRLDRAVAGVDLRWRAPRWWAAAGILQRALAAVAAVGAIWLLVLAGVGWLQLDDLVPTPDVAGVPAPTALLLGGLLAGLLLALPARLVNGFGARRRARRAQRALNASVAAVGEERVLAPILAELAARERLCAALRSARAG